MDERMMRWELKKRHREQIPGMPTLADIDENLSGDERALELLRRERDALSEELASRKEEYLREQWRLEVFAAKKEEELAESQKQLARTQTELQQAKVKAATERHTMLQELEAAKAEAVAAQQDLSKLSLRQS